MGSLNDELKKWAKSRDSQPMAGTRASDIAIPQNRERRMSVAAAAAPTGARKALDPSANAPAIVTASFGATPQPILTRNTEFKTPDSWVALGAGLQPPDGGSGRVLTVRIGVDFGTAYTKVGIRTLDKVFFVDWSGVRVSGAPYLLPGEFCRVDIPRERPDRDELYPK